MAEEKLEEKKEEQSSKKCRIYYKVGWMEGGGYCLLERFDFIDPCCESFLTNFSSTGNTKNTDWNKNNLFEEGHHGLNFSKRGGSFYVLFNKESIQFCPWSGHEIVIQKSKDVLVRPKMKQVPDGKEEVGPYEPKEGWDQ